jgi:hypothetical protein
MFGPKDGKFPFVTFKTAWSDKPLEWLMRKVVDNYYGGFSKIDPFARYINEFPQYFGILPFEESAEDLTMFRKSIVYDPTLIMGAYVHTATGLNRITAAPNISAMGIMHEAGHAVCGLADEYTRSELTVKNPFSTDSVKNYGFLSALNNCQYCPNISFLPYGKPYLGCGGNISFSSYPFYRTSYTSIMWDDNNPRFNLWGCAICRAKILGIIPTIETLQEQAQTSINEGMDCISETPSKDDLTIKERKCPGECSSKYDCMFVRGWDIECVDSCTKEHKCVMKEAGSVCVVRGSTVWKCIDNGLCVSAAYEDYNQ